MGKTCPNCKSSEFDVDPARGDTVCMNCGSVLEENRIVSEVTIQENADGSASVVGQFVASEGSYNPHLSGFQYGIGKESRQVTLDKGKTQIREMAALLNLNRHCVDTAFNFFKMAISKRLSRGRRITHIVAACLYMTCRTEGTPHLLLDFSDITQVNVFILGKVFLLLAKELHINLPVLGYLGKKWEGTSYPASTYWNPTVNEHWHWQHSVAPSIAHSIQTFQEKAASVPQFTDEYNLKTSSRANTFSATTRVREVPVNGIYKKEIQEFRSRTPSARGVRAVAISNRSLIASQRAHSVGAASVTSKTHSTEQPSRMQRELEQLQLTRERKRQAQLTSHRMDRMYYLNGSSSKIHSKYRISDEELHRIRMIATSRGMKVPSLFSHKGGSISGPQSTPRDPDEAEEKVTRQGSGRTVIPTADTVSIGDVVSLEGAEKSSSGVTKEDRATSDNEDDRLELLRDLEEQKSDASRKDDNEDQVGEVNAENATEKQDTVSVKSDSAVISSQRNVTFLTELNESEKAATKS